ncbi:hypothetical protein L248_1201 [Schleiferilactobacillus shenzhenensis LY-73]|uniref:Ig-like domain-containing protein n=2 Tax=Schleiferilactobacillus shenzhenensis TaxID=1231337 RepID=U4TPE7_9LACO|nr:hypothetical protein L248_1201 [Schleiferilactobacillus shenzhenensis LY-73]
MKDTSAAALLSATTNAASFGPSSSASAARAKNASTVSSDTALQDGTVPTAPKLTTQPSLSNFYIEASGYALYGGVGSFKVFAYKGNSGDQLYGFYIILPAQLTADLADVQKATQDYLALLQANMTDGQHTYTISSLTAYQLHNTSTATGDRQVFYFRPNDGAKKNVPVEASWDALNMPVKVKEEGAISPSLRGSVSFNANTVPEIPQYGVLFAGTGDYSFVNQNSYYTITPDKIGLTADELPDKNIAGIALTDIRRVLNLTGATVVDTYNLVDADTGAVIMSKTKSGDSGDYYSRVGLVDTLTSWDPSLHTTYWQRSMTIDSGSLTDTHVEWVPSDWHSDTNNPTIAGKTYTIKVSKIKTSLKLKQLFVDPGGEWQWTDSVDSLIGPDGTKLATADVQESDNVDTNKPGIYSVSISYKDTQGNISSAKTLVVVETIFGGIVFRDNNLDGIFRWPLIEPGVDGTKTPIHFQLFKKNAAGSWQVEPNLNGNTLEYEDTPQWQSMQDLAGGDGSRYQFATTSSGTFRVGISKDDLDSLHLALTILGKGTNPWYNSQFDESTVVTDKTGTYYLTPKDYVVPASGGNTATERKEFYYINAGVYSSEINQISLTPPTLQFGKHPIPSVQTTYQSQNTVDQLSYTDNRDMTHLPFTISVQASQFVDQTASTHSVGLQGAYFTFQQLGNNMPSFRVDTGGDMVKLFNISGSTSQPTNIMLQPTQLTVPPLSQTTAIESGHQYRATLTWTLSDGV